MQPSVLLWSIAALWAVPVAVLSCNEALCASVVSKCMLTQSCKCELKNCTCCRDCSSCLADLYTECCSCVELCPKNEHNDSDTYLSQKSHVEDLLEPLEQLFEALTMEPDPQLRWVSYTYPAEEGISIFHDIRNSMVTSQEDWNKVDGLTVINCTVAFMSQCMSWHKCKNSCRSMGANSYRWFHNGCCECVGKNCLNYGINESRCVKCPDDREISELQDYDDFLGETGAAKAGISKDGPEGNSADVDSDTLLGN